jgi:hypothetical protein
MKAKYKLIASLLTTVLIVSSILLLPGAASGMIVDLNADDSSYLLGEYVNFTASIALAQGEEATISEVILRIEGPEPFSKSLPLSEGTYNYPRTI